MGLTEHIERHILDGRYGEKHDGDAARGYVSREGWTDYVFNVGTAPAADADVLFSHRRNAYTRETFTEHPHRHDFFEVVVYLAGEIRYVVENRSVMPSWRGSVLICPPGAEHTAVLLRQGIYDRYVFYLSPALAEHAALFSVSLGETFCYGLSEEETETLAARLSELEAILQKEPDAAFFRSRALLFSVLSDLSARLSPGTHLPEHLPAPLGEIREYIDRNFASITGVDEVATRFYYSREYLSRLFRKNLNVTVRDYIIGKKLARARELLLDGHSVTDACYRSGFRNMSTFVRDFRAHYHLLPSDLKRGGSEGREGRARGAF